MFATRFSVLAMTLALLAHTPRPLHADGTAENESDQAKPLPNDIYSGLQWRSIGPAITSGRVTDFAVNPNNRAQYYVASASGGVWKTDNAGVTWEPVFDKQGSYSIGCVTMDPNNPFVVWVGTGENNSQRSVSFGDGVYRSLDGGKTWKNMGLKDSEHIGMIVVDPRDSNVVYVAAQGPLWRAGGDRGLYKTIDGGKTWTRVLHVSDDTGVNEIHMDPRDPDILYATSYQRRRRVWTLINGGPESALYKSTDAGNTWRKITSGIPKVDKGRIGLCVSPADPDTIYAIIEAADGKGGVFRSTDRGENWKKRNGYVSTSPQYYNELVCDPNDVDRVYSLDTFMHVTEDGGKTFKRAPRAFRHVDDHAMYIDPDDSNYLLVGCDGGVYESFDRGGNWQFKANLPITQFYRVALDNAEPFYYVYGGTQDNNTLGGPSRTISPGGITNDDWFVTVGGDGFETQVDPTDPNIVYSQWQYGGLVRHDRRSGEVVDIKPREKPGEDPYRWNWDSPLLISPHNPQRLYFAANILFRSDDRGNSWTAVSGDLSRGLDRNKLKVMGRVQPADAVAKNKSTSIFGNCVALDESPLVEGLIYVGTDDGLIHVTEDGGKNWRKMAVFPYVPDMTYVSSVIASRHNPDRVFATFDNHKNGDFKPYVLRSDDRGQTWESITGDLPEREICYMIKEDHVKPDLLFVGTEFGAYFTADGGTQWIKLKAGLPTIAVRDVEIQRRENDVVLATFGRGFYILDDYSPLRMITHDMLEKDYFVFPVKDALRYVQTNRLGSNSGKGFQGASYYVAKNPPYGAVFTYYLKEGIKTRKEKRHEAEKKAIKAGKDPRYPDIEELRAEDEEIEPQILLLVRDESGTVVRRVTGPRTKGTHRVAWNLRYPASTPVTLRENPNRPYWVPKPAGPLALPGKYTVTLASQIDGVITELTTPTEFNVVPLDHATFTAQDKTEVLAFRRKMANLQRAARGALRAAGEVDDRLAHLRKAYLDTPNARPDMLARIHELQSRLNALQTKLNGDQTRAKRNEPTPPSILARIENVVYNQWYTTSPPTQTERDAYRYAGESFTRVLADLKSLIEDDLADLEQQLELAQAPWTPGRLPVWKME